MPIIEVFNEGQELLFSSDFSFLPRVGEHVARDVGGFYEYYDVLKVWHREAPDGRMNACIAVRLDD